MKLTIHILKDQYAICKLHSDPVIQDWIKEPLFFSITRTDDEWSVVCRQSRLPANAEESSPDWRILRLSGPLDFSLVGIIAHISEILKNADIPIFTISTYRTDYILVKNDHLEKAVQNLRSAGHKVTYL